MSRPSARWQGWDDDFADDEGAYEAASRLVVARAKPAYAPAPSGAPAAQPRWRIRWGQLAVVAIVGYLLVVGASSEVTLLGVTHQANALQAQVAGLTASNRMLRHEVSLLHQRRYVDELARTELGYVSPGEVELVPTTVHGPRAGAARS